MCSYIRELVTYKFAVDAFRTGRYRLEIISAYTIFNR